ncbi:T9SS type A sorting domain-containing protein [Pontimicrobium sp. IMCC45349]|uniref:T9SS type A sorting domain-containing protein n=1 Tax=Pontimicrobium sp. IMCC45349 TaxID=3391574 RepID=UPI00399FBD7B
MKKITLFFILILAFSFKSYAQDTCATALSVTTGVTSVAAIDGTEIPDPICAANDAGATGGEWYSFTATVDGVVNITTDLQANAGGDTRLHVYEGTCGSLTCLAGNDDVSNTNYLSNTTFVVSPGTTYIFAFDDRWSAAGFDFELTETAVSCSTAAPYSFDFTDFNHYLACYTFENVAADATGWGYNNGNDFDGDTVNDPVALVWAEADTTVKDDWLFLPVFNGTANATYDFTFSYNVFNNPAAAASESFEVVVLDAPSSTAGVQSVLGTYTGITQSGAGVPDLLPNAYSNMVSYTPTTDGDFYLAIRATTPSGNSGILMFFTLGVAETLSLPDFESNVFTHFYNNDTKDLIIESSTLPFDNIEIYNIMGQNVFSKSLSQTTEAISLSNYNDGIYLAKVSIQGKTKTVKILKH